MNPIEFEVDPGAPDSKDAPGGKRLGACFKLMPDHSFQQWRKILSWD